MAKNNAARIGAPVLLPLLLLVPPVLTAGPARAAIFADRAACLAKAEAAPDFAVLDAQAWEKQGGGRDARLCQAMALLLSAQWEAAGMALERVVLEQADQPASFRANLWGRAGMAWTRAKQPDRAAKAYEWAIGLAPADAQLRLDRAALLMGQEKFWDALVDLDHVLAANPALVDGLLLRAQAHRSLARDSSALEDLGTILAGQPDHAEALLLRGRLRLERGDLPGARTDWTRLTRTAPDSPQATLAADYLSRLATAEAEAAKQ